MGLEISREDRSDARAKMARETLRTSRNCAQTAFAVLQQEFELEGKEILRALTPFPGIALRGETCGAVTGCLMAIGLVYGRNDLDDWKSYVASLPPSRRFCRRFEEQYGSTACADILDRKMGHRYDLANRVEAVKYALGGGKKVCGEVVTSAVQIAAQIITEKTRAD